MLIFLGDTVLSGVSDLELFDTEPEMPGGANFAFVVASASVFDRFKMQSIVGTTGCTAVLSG